MLLDTSALVKGIVTDYGTEIARVSYVKLEAVAAVSQRQIEGFRRVLTRVPGGATVAQQ